MRRTAFRNEERAMSRHALDGPHALLLDFDGTSCTVDVGHSLFKRFARDREGWMRLVQRWNAGLLGGRDCLAEECELARATRDEIEAFCEPMRLDPGFAEVVARARRLGWEIAILSDGLEFYIQRSLEREGFGEIPVRANKVRFEEGARLVPEFPHWGGGCGRCGACKGTEIARRRALGQRVWFVGDGVSDRCAAPVADRLFAKRDLARFASERGIAFTPFETLADVLAHIA
jgi:2,3-diketo-5-methylthio-1-phosphopentane phosphatase